MNLQPPSFFEVPPPSPEERATESSILKKWREEVTRLNTENKILKDRLEAYTTPLSATVSPPRLPPPAPLTSDLLHVEEQLQSRVRMLDGEKRQASLQALQLEKALASQKKQFHAAMETLRGEHEVAMCKVESKKQKLSVELQAYREDQERKVRLLTEEISRQQECHAAQTEQLAGDNSKLEHRLGVLEYEKNEVVGELHSKLASTSKQLELSREEVERLKLEDAAQISALTEQVSAHCQKVKRLEAYLGGEIPDLSTVGRCEGGGGKTWKEEREFLYKEIQKTEHEAQKLRSENYLVGVRLSSMSEILALQEADITKGSESDTDKVRGLLKRWREKVYALLVQRKLQEIEEARSREQMRRKEVCFTEKVEEAEREQMMLSHALADRDAQIQLQQTKIEALQAEVAASVLQACSLESKLHSQGVCCAAIQRSVQHTAEQCAGFRDTFNQALTKLAATELRVAFAAERLRTLKATLEFKHALLCGKSPATTSDAWCQCGGEEEEEEGGGRGEDRVLSLSREQLKVEVETLSHERDNLIAQISEGTVTFQEQLKSVKEKHAVESGCLREQVSELERECGVFQQSLAQLELRLRSSEEDSENFARLAQERDKELQEVHATVESRIECEVARQKERGREELVRMEELLDVARREHSKAVLQLQQLTRKMAVQKERVTEMAEVGKDKMEQDLAASRKLLQAVTVERNLLLTTLRQESESPLLQPRHLWKPRQRVCKEQASSLQQSSKQEGRGGGGGSMALNVGLGESSQEKQRLEGGGEGAPQEQEDIRDVLKDLHALSASLLSLESESRPNLKQ